MHSLSMAQRSLSMEQLVEGKRFNNDIQNSQKDGITSRHF